MTITNSDHGMSQTLQTTMAARKRRFHAALALAGISARAWCKTVYPVSRQHLTLVFQGEREPSAKLLAAVDGFIAQHLPPSPAKRRKSEAA